MLTSMFRSPALVAAFRFTRAHPEWTTRNQQAQESPILDDERLPQGGSDAHAPLSQATAAHAGRFLQMLPSTIPLPNTRRQGPSRIVFEWVELRGRQLSASIGPDGVLSYRASFGAQGRLEGAEPLGQSLSPALAYAVAQYLRHD